MDQRAAQVDTDVPAWLADTKHSLLATPQWKALVDQVFSAVQVQLTESRTLFFTDLKDAEKQLVIDRAVSLGSLCVVIGG